MKSGDIVSFVDEYDGYFEYLKGKQFTVRLVYEKDDSIDTPCVCLHEIKEIHLISVRHLKGGFS
jgi:hypothetical protein